MEILGKGSSGDGVKRLQERLQEFGFYQGDITSNFNEETENAVKAFQDTDGLAADGIVGVITLHGLNLLPINTTELV
ncbi:MAG: peptidoglycan-binding protein [Symploca sp. SIO2E6]|nr:peptidoglycan-binding protein [Symploca sp. SIO2E6]